MEQTGIVLSEIKDLAIKAGEAILEVYRSDDLGVSAKADNSPLTEADKRADAIIVEGLKALTPDIPRLTEESAAEPFDKRKSWERFWLVDPLDGTKEFIKKSGQFTVNIALIEQGSPVLGVVWAPEIELHYWAERGKGAFVSDSKGERRIKAREANSERLSIVASKDHAGPQVEALKAKFEGCELKSMGSSLKLCLVASGEADVYLRDAPTMEWDTGAAHAIVKEAGGVVQVWNGNQGGEELVYNKENLRNPQFLVKGDPGFEIRLD